MTANLRGHFVTLEPFCFLELFNVLRISPNGRTPDVIRVRLSDAEPCPCAVSPHTPGCERDPFGVDTVNAL